jgi:arylformamidase
VLDHASVRGGLAISGIYDLEPLRHSYLNDKLQLDAASARRNSPLWQPPATAPRLAVVVGGRELPELRRQSRDFALDRCQRGLDCPHQELPDADHFSILKALADPHGALSRLLREQLLTR